MEADKKIPVHVSIIMDGNGRWAKERGQERVYGHIEGVNSVRACTEEAVKQGVKYLSLFAFSEENWGRPEKEVSALMKLMMKSIESEVKTLMDNGVRFVVLGDRERLAPEVRMAIEGLEGMTAANNRLTMVVFFSYSGKGDIRQAAARMAAADSVPSPVYRTEAAALSDEQAVIRGDRMIRTQRSLQVSSAATLFLPSSFVSPQRTQPSPEAPMTRRRKVPKTREDGSESIMSVM